jgi:hypothetical protein
VVGRESIFAQPEIVKLVSEGFIPAAADDWYQRRRDDEVGKFFIGVADQGPRKGEGGSTRQGIYCFTASGKLLTYRNHHDPSVMLEEFRTALARFAKLPASQREPGAVKVPELTGEELDRQYTRKLPEGGVVIRVYTRVLERDREGNCRPCEREEGKSQYGLLSAQDHLWLLEVEWKSLLAVDARAGTEVELPRAVVDRMIRFHMTDNTRGEPEMWEAGQIRKNRLRATVVESSANNLKLRLEGELLLSTEADAASAKRGYDARLLGYIELDRAKPVITRFDVVVLGEHWGESTFTRGARPGRMPLGVVFELADGKQAADAVPPQAARNWQEYFGRPLR